MTAGVGKARPPRSFPTGLKKCLRPGAQTQTVEKPRIGREPRFLRPGCSIIRASLTVARTAPIFAGGSETMSAPEGSVSPVGCQAQRKATRRCAGGKCQPCGLLPPKAAKRPEGVSKYKGCARPARRTPIFANEQTQGCARPARTAPIFAKGREARMIEQPGRKKRGSFQNHGFFNGLSAALPQWKGGALRQALANLPRTLSICCCWACSLGYQPWAAIFW